MIKVEAKFGEATISIESGRIARQADGAVVVRMGETMVLVTAVASNNKREGLDFVPLTMEYMEKFYAVGRIPGNFFRREVGRPSEKETLTARFIDRPCRPLFPENWTYETQVISHALSVDEDYDPDILAMLGASCALTISDIPFNGPIAGAKVVRVDGKLIVNPTQKQIDSADLNLIVAAGRDAVMMVEGGAAEASEEEILEAVFLAHEAIQPLLDIQLELQKKLGKSKRQADEIVLNDKLIAKIKSSYDEQMLKALTTKVKLERQAKINELHTVVQKDLAEEFPESESEIKNALNTLASDILRGLIVKDGRRIDERKLTEVRPIESEVTYLPRAHGSALFTRGETQSIGVTTLGTSYDDQRMDTLIGKSSKNFMLHYNFPPYSTGEVKRLGSPGRREIGHGALAERALSYVLPSQDDFPYTIRVVSEITESNGSSSMASVCTASLSLMDAGVPISGAVAGIAMGLIVEGDDVVILTDILGDEDHLGDMDFKVAGTKKGITAVQMDIKISGVSKDIMSAALKQAKAARIHILEKMDETLDHYRPEISQYAPKMTIMEINPDKIKDVIGPGGKNIKAIQSGTETRIEIEDSGRITIYAPNNEQAQAAVLEVKRYTQEPEIDEVYNGKVVKIMDFGAFVEILPGTDGLVHISQLALERVNKVTDILQEGDEVKVKVLGIDKQGKIRLSRKALLLEEEN